MSKKVVAIAGGSSPGLGNAIITALLSSPTFQPLILSRSKPSGPNESTDTKTGIVTKYVDYASLSSLKAALQGAHTVISVILAPPDTWLTTQVNLLHAAREVGVKRFAPSEFSLGPMTHEKCLPIFQPKLDWWEECKKVAAASNGEFEIGRFHTGYFMNYLGYGCPYDTEAALGGRSTTRDEPPLFFYLRDGWVEIPEKDGGGIPRITLTELADVGKFVHGAVELPDGEWEEEMGMVGETLKFDEVAKTFEEVTGKKLRVETVTRETLQKNLDDAMSKGEFLWVLGNQFSLCYCEDKVGVGVIDGVINRKCPDIKPLSVRKFLERYWAGMKNE
jgi:hypothetical protein